MFPALLPADHFLDSLLRRHLTLSGDSEKVFSLIRIANRLRVIAADTTEDFFQDLVRYSEESGCRVCRSEALLTLSTREIDRGDFKSATLHVIQAMNIAEKAGNKSALGRAYNSLAEIYAYQDLYPQAKKYFLDAAKIFAEMKQENYLAIIYMNLANIEYSLAQATGDFKPALELYEKSASIHREKNNIQNLVSLYGNISNVYIDMGDFRKAHQILDSNLALCEQHGLVAEKTNVLYYIGRAYAEEKKLKESRDYFFRGLELAEKQNHPDMVSEIYTYLGYGYESEGDYRNALLYFRRGYEIRDSLFKSENTRQLNEMSARFESDKKDLELKTKDERIARQKVILISSIGGGLLLLLLLIVYYSRFQLKQKANKKLESAYRVIETKNKDITDSINYARKIQTATLPDDEVVKKIFPGSFIYFLPRDIVSGDFYWVAEKSGRKFFAVADCTGHGVPGSMMSMIGNALLNQVVLEQGILSPADILNEIREEIIRSLRQSEESNSTKDGMDISLCALEEVNGRRMMHFAGANNSLYLVRGKQLMEFKADPYPVGITAGELKSFTTHTVELLSGDSVFLFTDGFADQFGGPRGKKFKYGQLKNVFIEISGKNPDRQLDDLSSIFETWKGSLEQIDDVCIAGIKI